MPHLTGQEREATGKREPCGKVLQEGNKFQSCKMDKAGVKHNSKKADFKYYGDHDRELMRASTQTCNSAAEHVKKMSLTLAAKLSFWKTVSKSWQWYQFQSSMNLWETCRTAVHFALRRKVLSQNGKRSWLSQEISTNCNKVSFCLFDMILSLDLICEVFGFSPGDPCGKGGLGDWMRSEVKCA